MSVTVLSPYFLRHPPGHAYFDPNDFLEGIQQDIEREGLEYEVKHHLCLHLTAGFYIQNTLGQEQA